MSMNSASLAKANVSLRSGKAVRGGVALPQRKSMKVSSRQTGLQVLAATKKMVRGTPDDVENADKIIPVPGFEQSYGKKMKVSTKGAAAAQKNLGYSDAQGQSAFGGKVYKLTTSKGNVDEYSPIYSPEYFNDDFVTGCSNKTYVLILGVIAAASVGLPAAILGISVAINSEPVNVFPFNLL